MIFNRESRSRITREMSEMASSTKRLANDLIRDLTSKEVAILGSPGVGKSTLLQFLMTQELTATVPTDAPAAGGTFLLEVDDRETEFLVARDLPGDDLHLWQKAFGSADYVFYLFRADRLAVGDSHETEIVSKHFQSMRIWLDQNFQDPKVLLIGTWSDAHAEQGPDTIALARQLRSSPFLSDQLVRLQHAGLVVGSLSSTEAAQALRTGIQRQIESR